jgi:hypothetical protein
MVIKYVEVTSLNLVLVRMWEKNVDKRREIIEQEGGAPTLKSQVQ